MSSICRGDIWIVDLNPTQGSEIQKQRPCVVISGDNLGRLPLKIVVPITEWKDGFVDYLWMIKLTPSESNNLSKLSAADSFQVRSVDEKRFVSKKGAVSPEELEDIVAAIAILIRVQLPD
ncbi:MAG: type II toxin-antitoxin system PemK/MazF family toxin [Syntrophomonadaceae bacterium]|jgi:mRNA interferase MazF|nr:type II toxin-antitoxin system PemK/MazF family toxin [Syntrophomonadaceae bacterium]MDD3899517.1 type II toxin-antitoxin system PemK/MazF family toxin [Syntrophomonadaceae bacterium]